MPDRFLKGFAAKLSGASALLEKLRLKPQVQYPETTPEDYFRMYAPKQNIGATRDFGVSPFQRNGVSPYTSTAMPLGWDIERVRQQPPSYISKIIGLTAPPEGITPALPIREQFIKGVKQGVPSTLTRMKSGFETMKMAIALDAQRMARYAEQDPKSIANARSQAYKNILPQAEVKYERIQREHQEWLKKHPELEPSPEFNQSLKEGLVDPRNKGKRWQFIAHRIVSGGIPTATALGAGIATYVVTGSPVLGGIASAAVFAPMEHEEVFNSVLEAGGTKEQAAQLANIATPIITTIEGLSDVIQIDRIMGGSLKAAIRTSALEGVKATTRKLISRGLTNFLVVEASETLEETLQEFTKNAAVKVVNKDKRLLENIPAVMLETPFITAPFAFMGGVRGMYETARMQGIETPQMVERLATEERGGLRLPEGAMNQETWNAMPVPQRVELAKSAGLSGQVGNQAWEALRPDDRVALEAQAVMPQIAREFVMPRTYEEISAFSRLTEEERISRIGKPLNQMTFEEYRLVKDPFWYMADNPDAVNASLRRQYDKLKAEVPAEAQAVRPQVPTAKAPEVTPVTPEVITLYRGEPRGIREPTTDVPFTPDRTVAEGWAGKEGRVVAVTLSREEFGKLRFQKLPQQIATYFVSPSIYARATEVTPTPPTGITAQPGLPGVGPEAVQAKAFGEFGVAPGQKPSLIDIEAYRRAQEAKPLPGQISMEDQMRLDEARRRAELEIESYRDFLATDPVASAKFKLGTKIVGKGETRKVIPIMVGLDAFISIKEQAWPEHFTVKQAQALMPGHDFSQYLQTNKVPLDVGLDDVSEHFNLNVDQLAEKAMQIRRARRAIASLSARPEQELAGIEAPQPAVEQPTEIPPAEQPPTMAAQPPITPPPEKPPTAEMAMPKEDPVAKLTRLIKEAKPVREITEATRKAERKPKVGAYAGMFEKAKTIEEAQRARGALKGKYFEATWEPFPDEFTPEEMSEFLARIHASDLRVLEQGNALDALVLMINEGKIPTPSEQMLLERVYGSELIKALLEKRSLGEKAWSEFVSAINLPRSIQTAYDVSATLRQGGLLSVTHPVLASKAFVSQLKAMAKAENSQAVDKMIRNRVKNLGDKAGKLYIAPLGGVTPLLSQREEAFISRWAQKIPGIRASERAYVTYLNLMRIGSFESDVRLLEGALGKELTQSECDELATGINILSGRGEMGRLGAASPLLSGIMYSPRYALSRVETPFLLFTTKSGAVRMIMARYLITGLMVGLTTIGLAALAGLSVETDPRSSDAGKIRWGNMRWDIWAGYQQWMRMIAQFITGQRKTAGGKIEKISRMEVLSRFAQSKASPIVGIISDILSGRSYTGEEIELTPESIAKNIYNRLAPMGLADIIDAYNDSRAIGGFVATPALLGIGVQTYGIEWQKLKDPLVKMGKIDTEGMQEAIKKAETQVDILREQEKDWTYRTSNLGSEINKLIGDRSIDQLKEETKIPPLALYYKEYRDFVTEYEQVYNKDTKEQSAMRNTWLAKHPDAYVAMLFWGYRTTGNMKQIESVRELAKLFQIPESAIEALNKAKSQKVDWGEGFTK